MGDLGAKSARGAATCGARRVVPASVLASVLVFAFGTAGRAVAAPAAPAGPVRIVAAQPQGDAAAVRQVRVRFDRAVVPLGDMAAPDPFELRCEGEVPAGSGRWASEREWIHEFADALPPGVRCTVQRRTGWSPRTGDAAIDGAPVVGPARFSFATGGPAVVRVQPWPGSTVDEDALFLLQFNGEPSVRSVRENTACIVEGVGDRIPTRLVEGPEREPLLSSQRVPRRLWPRTVVLGCDRPLPVGAAVRLVVLPGVALASRPAVASRSEQSFTWTVRPAFTAEFSCERERAGAPCWPVRPLTLAFSAPAARADLQQVRLRRLDGGTPGESVAAIVEGEAGDPEARYLRFPVPLAENARYAIELPAGLRDTTGRALANAASFPLSVGTASAPPIAKFAAAPFGVIELEAAGRGTAPRGVLPLTLRHVQPDFDAGARAGRPSGAPATAPMAPTTTPAAPAGAIRVRRFDTAADILAWLGRVERYHESSLTAREAGLPEPQWHETIEVTDEEGRVRPVRRERRVATRELPLLRNDPAAAVLPLPPPPARDGPPAGAPRPFEVVGLPLAAPGYHVVEVESPRLGAALLEPAAPMFVRTGVLVTNLGVHLKHGRESSAVWVTTLDRGRPVAGAEVSVHDCRGGTLWTGRTDVQGVARIAQPLDPRPAVRPAVPAGRRADPACPADEALFVMARHATPARGGMPAVNDVAFVLGSWQRGIEPWRFDLPQRREAEPDRVAHTVFDRTLLRAGETVSMKHFLRVETARGLSLPAADALPPQVVLVHAGSGQETVRPVAWNGVRSATSTWAIPAGARLGRYEVWLERRAPATVAGPAPARERTWAGEFRVEAFRVPLIEARLVPPPTVSPGARELTLGVQMSYLAGGGVQSPGTSISALLAPRAVAFEGHEGWRFDPPRTVREGVAAGPDDEEGAPAAEAGRLVVDKQPVATDRQGAAQVALRDLPAIDRPSELLAELRFTDPNGETQTVARRVALWPSAVVVGLRAPPWARQGARTALDVVALDTVGTPLRGQAVQVRGRLVQVSSTRKRLVGGFYAYENRTDVRDLGVLCEGHGDERGQLRCELALAAPGEVELIAEARDASGRVARSATSVWVTRAGDLWFGQDDDDRIDLVPEKRRVAPGETARLQVRSPFREATALVSVEREGVIDTRVVALRGDDPTVEVKVDAAWTPNVVVSVLAVRGRIRAVPWTSFFDWGWREPVAWWRAWRDEGPQHQPPTPLVDLAKPSFKLGATMLAVGGARHDLQVSVVPDAPRYAIRQTAQVRVRVTRDGQPLSARPEAGAAPVVDVAFAAVDEGLLALADNPSWDLKAGLLRERPWGVATSTAHGEIVGRRHYGRKAVAAGGGGGRGATRELFDTLLVWKASVALDTNGEAVVPVPLNDSLTRFRLVAVADALIAEGPGEPLPAFGTGSATIEVSQDLQVLPGLPLLMREGDRLDALLTVRNTTPRPMSLDVRLRGLAVAQPGGTAPPVIAPPPQSVQVAAGAAAELRFPIEVPPEVAAIDWEAVAEETGAAPARASDRVRRRVPVAAAVPLRVQQATLAPLTADSALAVPVAPPPGALMSGSVARGGVQVALRPRLADGLPGLVRWFEAYPYSCLEQRASRALALDDRAGWEALVATLPAHLDADGLAAFFPLGAGEGVGPGRGSDRLTAHLVSAAHEAGAAWPAEVLEPMLGGLLAFVEGRLERRGFAPPASRGLDRDVRRLAALEALSRHGRAEARHLGTLRADLAAWPTAALLDWLAVLRRVPGVPDAARRAEQVRAALRQRLDFSGTTLRFSREADDLWWWNLDSPDGNAARLVLAAVDDPAWADELPRLVTGHLGRQRDGAWLTTTANLWSALALRRFSQRFESTPVAGRTQAALGAVEQAHDWAAQPAGGALAFAWTGAAPATLALRHEGPGRPWVTLQAEAAVPLTAPRRAGYGIERRIVAVDRRTPDAWSRGDVLRVRLEVEAAADMSWVVVDDPVPAGATVLGSGGARDSAIAQRVAGREAPRDGAALAIAPTYVERRAGAWRAYFEWLPRGRHVLEYTVRLNQPGRFGLPPTRVEAMYAPDRFGEAPNAALEVLP